MMSWCLPCVVAVYDSFEAMEAEGEAEEEGQ